ncbi:MAG: peptidoglycan-binding protein [Clostridia bacterium]|nr:peptidoglycan-binding protein [Clostridia bacterium]
MVFTMKDKMRPRRFLTVVVMLFLLITPLIALASGNTGTVNCSTLNLRSQASKDSKALQTLSKGDEVTILSTSGDWYKVTYGKYTGYVMKKYISKGSSNSSSKNTSKTSNQTNTSSSSKASSSTTLLAQLKKIGKPTACEYGASGSNVKKLQKCLQAYGYYTGNIDGDYGPGTKSAVKKLQKAKGLKQTGTADSATIAAMFGEKASASTKTSGAKTSSSSKTITTERLNWFKNGVDRIPKGATFTVKHCKTGKTFTCKRWSGANHLDAEPLTKTDTGVLKTIYGGWSWKRRPILVKYNGRVYAASMYGMPHGTTTIKNNNFDGHFCIHFYGSKTHGTKKVDDTHQNCVATAMNYTW